MVQPGGESSGRDDRYRQYDYHANAGLVLNQGRRRGQGGARGGAEPTGEAETLRGRIDARAMGDRAAFAKPDTTGSKKQASAVGPAPKKRKTQAPPAATLADDYAIDGCYQPRSQETRRAYEAMLSIVREDFGDQPRDVMRFAADEIIAALRAPARTDAERRNAVSDVLAASGTLGNALREDKFQQLVALSKLMTDFEDDDAAGGGGDGDGDRGNIGVAVEFDSSSSDESASGEDSESEDGSDGPDARMGEAGPSFPDAPVARDAGPQASDDAKLDPQAIDAYWLQRLVSTAFPDRDSSANQEASEKILEILSTLDDMAALENELVALFEYGHFGIVKMLCDNRHTVCWCTRLARAGTGTEERRRLEAAMVSDPALSPILDALERAQAKSTSRDREAAHAKRLREEASHLATGTPSGGPMGVGAAATATPHAAAAYSHLDLASLAFAEGCRLNTAAKCTLPEGSTRSSSKDYEEVFVPALPKPPMGQGEELVAIAALPEWARPAFANMQSLNRVQSRVCEAALFGSENMLVCAPTGAGKTNVALLTMLHEIGLSGAAGDAAVAAGGAKRKIVYIAPMKALVAEMVGNFSKRLEHFGLRVRELTGDVSLTRKELMDEADVLVSTPEKWDVVTRKARNRAFTSQVKLVIIDEVHLLHDVRGAVLESIVSRTVRQVEVTREMTRLVGLSATLPNYTDVAAFLRVPKKNLFVFGNEYRPCPLQQHFIGITVRKPLQRLRLMNELCLEKVREDGANGKHQILVFVHSRKETVKTAKHLRDGLNEGGVSLLAGGAAASREILRTEVPACKSADLADILPSGIGIHHAGLSRADRTLVEDLFADGHLRVLVSTATLAWGVNLPAHTVIIKGTEVYNPDRACWEELSQLDVMQMLGRAGRPQFDTHGVGTIITSQRELQFYLSLFNEQLPIESQFVKKLADALNAEVASGTIQTVNDAITWLGYTYLFVRTIRNPTLYGATADEDAGNEGGGVPGGMGGGGGGEGLYHNHRGALVHSAAISLERHGLIKYDRRNGMLHATDLGRIASTYYVSAATMATYGRNLKPSAGEMELCHVFALSEEFRHVVVREEDKLELAKLLDRVPIPVKESVEDPTAKINVLLQAYISQMRLDGFVLSSDMSFVIQNAGRLTRCLFEIVLRHGWAQAAHKALALCKMVQRRMWPSQTPLRQFDGVPADVLSRLEKKDVPWDRLYDMTPQELGELVRAPRMGKALHKLVHHFPKLELAAQLMPLTRSLLKVDLTITPDFAWDDRSHGFVELFWIIVEDSDSERVLHSEMFLLKKRNVNDEHAVSFTVLVQDPLPPQYFVRVVSDRWIGSETTLALSFRNLVLPQKNAPPTELLDLQPLSVSHAFRDPKVASAYSHVSRFNPIQTQCFPQLFTSKDNTLVCAPVGGGVEACAEFAILEALARIGLPGMTCVYVAPYESVVQRRLLTWQKRFGPSLGLKVMALSGETALDLKILESSNVVLTIPKHWDVLSRRWRHRKHVQNVDLFIVDCLHLIASPVGPCMEIITSRMRYIAKQTERDLRIVGLGASVANAKDLGEWIGAGTQSIFNFHSSTRPTPLQVQLVGFDSAFYESRMQDMVRPCYSAITQREVQTIVFVPTWKAARMATVDLISYAAAEGREKAFLMCEEEDLRDYLDAIEQKDRTLAHAVAHGVAFVHEAMESGTRGVVEKLFRAGALQVLVATAPMAWSLAVDARLVVVMGTDRPSQDASAQSDYAMADVQQMISKANNEEDGGGEGGGRREGEAGMPCTAIVMCRSSRKAQLLKFLQDPLPLESYLDHFLHDHMCAETVGKMVENKQDAVDYLTWTLFYRRLGQNPNYYNLLGVTHRHISDHLSELVETVVGDLEHAKCIAVEEEMDIFPLNLGMIATHYYLGYNTVSLFSESITAKTKLRGLLQLMSNAGAGEFQGVGVGPDTEQALRPLMRRIAVPVDDRAHDLLGRKVNVLLQAHCNRLAMSPEMKSEQTIVVRKAIRLLHAMVDIVSSSGWLQPALEAMEFCQLISQGMWTKDSWLMQLPHMTPSLAEKCSAKDISGVFDLLDMEDDERTQLLGLAPKAIDEIVNYAEAFPDIEVEHQVASGEDAVQVQVLLERKSAGNPHAVSSQAYPGQKSEVWWLVIGHVDKNELLAVKRVNLLQKSRSVLQFERHALGDAPAGSTELTLFFMSDSYCGLDQEYVFKV